MSTKYFVKTVLIALFALVGLQGCMELGTEDESSTEQYVRPPPAVVTAVATSQTRITVSWSAVTDATKYYVYRSTGAAGPFGFQGTTLAPGTSLLVANLLANTEYCFVVRTDGADGAGVASSPPACATTPGAAMPPAPPATVTATPTAADRITVSWSTVATANRYYVYQSVGAAGPYSFVGTTLAPSLSQNVANLMPGTTYCYRVAAESVAGVSVQSDPPACARTFILGLEAYWKLNEGTGTTATDVSGQGRNGTLQGAVSYSSDKPLLDNDPFSISSPGGAGDAVSVPDAPPLWLTGSFTVALWTKLPVPPSGSVPIIGKRVAGCGAVNWELAQDATNQLHFKGISGTALSFNQTLPTDTWTHVAVTFNTGTARLYINGVEVNSGAYAVGPRSGDPLQLANSGGCASGNPVFVDEVQIYSRQLSGAEVASIGTRPAPPANFTATVVSASRVNLTWDAVPGASKYLIYKGTAAGNQTFFASVLSPTLSFSDGTNQPSTQTSWFVRSVQNGLISDNSTEQVVTTEPPPTAPTGPTATLVGANRIQITWTGVAGAVKYYVYQSVNGGAFAFRGTVFAPGTSYLAAGLAAGTTYSYHLVTEDAALVRSAPSAATTPITTP